MIFLDKKKALFFKTTIPFAIVRYLVPFLPLTLFHYNARYFIFNFFPLVLELLYSFPVFPAFLVRLSYSFLPRLIYILFIRFVRSVVCLFVCF